jgi:hypothetical protein
MTHNPPKVLPKVPPSLGIDPIPGRIIGFYGFRSAREGIKDALLTAVRSGKPFYRIEMKVNVGAPPGTKRPGLKELRTLSFINFSLCKVELISDVLQILGVRAESVDEALSENPKAINRLWKHPRYKHIKAFVFDLTVNKKNHRVAFIRSPDLVEGVIITD